MELAVVAPLRLLHAREVPGVKALRTKRERCSAALHLGGGTWRSSAVALDAALHVFDALPSGEPMPAKRSGLDEDVHDDFFRIERVEGERLEIFLRAAIASYALFLQDIEDAPCFVASEKLDRLDRAFAMLTAWTCAVATGPEARVRAWKRATGPQDAMRRWIRGHQMFATITQGLIVAFAGLQDALLETTRTAAASTLTGAVDFAVALLEGAAAALDFTGDMSYEDYLEIVRPRMAPPLVPDTFSGLLASDHRYFVAMLREMKPVLDSLAVASANDHERLATAVACVYDSHKFVCDRLVGKAPSLMMMSGVGEKSGGEQIETFKKLRMRAFAPALERMT